MLRNSYTTYKIIPDINIKNNHNETLAQAMAACFRAPLHRITNKGVMEVTKFYFDIELSQNKAEFYLTIPQNVEELVINKAKTIWDKANIHQKPIESEFDIPSTEFAELVLKDFNFKSLSTDKGDLYPLTNIMAITKALNQDEHVRISMCFEPMKRVNWIAKANEDYKSFKSGKRMDREVSKKEQLLKFGVHGAETAINLYIEFQMLIFEAIMGTVMPDSDEEKKQIINVNINNEGAILNKAEGLSHQTTYKQSAEAFMTRILILSDSKDKQKAKTGVLMAANAFKDLSGDNELVMRFPNRKYIKEILKHNFDGSQELILCDREVAKLIQLPQRSLQKLYGLENIETKEVDLPSETLKGKIRVADVKLPSQNKTVTTYFSDDVKKVSFTNVIMGAEGCGKTTQIKRIAKECSWSGYSNILIDFVEDNKLAKEVREAIDPNKIVTLRIGDKGFIPALAYNEVSKLITEDLDSWMKIHYASMIAEQVEYLVNSITSQATGELSDAMVRLLNAACRVVFVKPNSTIGDVFDVLLRHDKRLKAVEYAKGVYDADSNLFYELETINDYDKSGKKVVGTKTSNRSLEGVLSRFTQLTKVPFLEAMLKAKIDAKDDFNQWIAEGKSVFIMIPQNLFPNPKTRDIITTYYMTRIWLAAQIREDNSDSRLCNLIFDEVHQMPNTASFIAQHVNEFRRHRLGLTISCHYLAQFKELEEAMLSKRTNYIICQSTQKDNVKKLQEEIAPFTLDDLSGLKAHEAICSINYPSGRYNFIGKLPT